MSDKADEALWISRSVQKTAEDHEARIRSLEHFMFKVFGMAALGGIIGGVVASVLEVLFLRK